MRDLKPIRSWPSSRGAEVPQSNEGSAGEAWHGGTHHFLLSPMNELGFSHCGDAAPSDHTMHWGEVGRACRAEDAQGEGRGTGLGFPCSPGCAFVPCISQPPCMARFSLPRDKAGFQLCLLRQFVAPGIRVDMSH